MDELGVSISFGPLDVLESISEIFSAYKLSRVEELRICAQLEEFKTRIENQQINNAMNRAAVREQMEKFNKIASKLLDESLKNQDIGELYKDIFARLLELTTILAIRISEIRITE